MKDYKNEKERLRSERERKEKQRQDIVNELKIKKVEKEGLKQENRSARIFKRGHMLEDFLVEPLVLSDDDVQDLLDAIFENMDVRALISLKIWEAKKRIIEEGDENA